MKPPVALLGPCAAAAVALTGCTNGQAQVDVTATNVATFPAPPAAVAEQVPDQVMATDGVVTLDLKGDLDSLANVGNLTAAVSKNALSGQDLDVLQHVRVTIAAADGQLPVQLVSDVDVPAGATELELPLLVDGSRLLEYLTEGSVLVHFYLTGTIPQRPLTLTHVMVAHVDVAVAGSVLKL
ncbi:MAG TPA: hypothetical protein VE987_10205 [Polyangiaceae bacterium]|nr:hypothetical protein [Polyangiaceae bacterium]